jgi:phosphoglycerate dehydrogenase-like enzyme
MLKVLSTVELEGRLLDRIRRVSPHLVLQAAHSEMEVRRLLADAEVVVTESAFNVEEAPGLKWVQWWGAGVDGLLGQPIMQSDVPLSTVSGIHAKPMAEYVLSQMVGLSRDLPRMMRDQMQHRWGKEHFLAPRRPELGGKKIGIVGYGNIGHEVARLALCLGMQVVATRRSATEHQWDGKVEVLPAKELPELLATSDFVVLCVPLTSETEGLIGERELQAMKTTAYMINIARGKVVDEPALIKALRKGWIAGAALDAFAQEPLPPGSDLWDLPNVIITPHVSADTDMYDERATDLFCENLRRYMAGEKLLNVVDKRRGY